MWKGSVPQAVCTPTASLQSRGWAEHSLGGTEHHCNNCITEVHKYKDQKGQGPHRNTVSTEEISLGYG